MSDEIRGPEPVATHHTKEAVEVIAEAAYSFSSGARLIHRPSISWEELIDSRKKPWREEAERAIRAARPHIEAGVRERLLRDEAVLAAAKVSRPMWAAYKSSEKTQALIETGNAITAALDHAPQEGRA